MKIERACILKSCLQESERFTLVLILVLLLKHLQLAVYRLHAYVVSAERAPAAAYTSASPEAANTHVERGEVLPADAKPMSVRAYDLVKRRDSSTVVVVTAAAALLGFAPARVAITLAVVGFPAC